MNCHCRETSFRTGSKSWCWGLESAQASGKRHWVLNIYGVVYPALVKLPFCKGLGSGICLETQHSWKPGWGGGTDVWVSRGHGAPWVWWGWSLCPANPHPTRLGENLWFYSKVSLLFLLVWSQPVSSLVWTTTATSSCPVCEPELPFNWVSTLHQRNFLKFSSDHLHFSSLKLINDSLLSGWNAEFLIRLTLSSVLFLLPAVLYDCVTQASFLNGTRPLFPHRAFVRAVPGPRCSAPLNPHFSWLVSIHLSSLGMEGLPLYFSVDQVHPCSWHPIIFPHSS